MTSLEDRGGIHPALDPDAAWPLAVSALTAEHLARMLEHRPALAVMSPEELRLLQGPTSHVSFESALDRAAFGMLEVRAVQRRDEADPFSGGPDAG